MTIRQKDSASSRILDSVYVEEGTPFKVGEIAKHIGVSAGVARSAVTALRDRCILSTDGRGTYWKHKPHFIHQRRLANPVTEEGCES